MVQSKTDAHTIVYSWLNFVKINFEDKTSDVTVLFVKTKTVPTWVRLSEKGTYKTL